MRQVVLQWTNDLTATFDKHVFGVIRENDWPRDRIAANLAKLPELLKRADRS
jgi:hypothetical protein